MQGAPGHPCPPPGRPGAAARLPLPGARAPSPPRSARAPPPQRRGPLPRRRRLSGRGLSGARRRAGGRPGCDPGTCRAAPPGASPARAPAPRATGNRPIPAPQEAPARPGPAQPQAPRMASPRCTTCGCLWVLGRAAGWNVARKDGYVPIGRYATVAAVCKPRGQAGNARSDQVCEGGVAAMQIPRHGPPRSAPRTSTWLAPKRCGSTFHPLGCLGRRFALMTRPMTRPARDGCTLPVNCADASCRRRHDIK